MSTRCTLAVRTNSSSLPSLAGYYPPLTPSAGFKFLVARCVLALRRLIAVVELAVIAVANSCALFAAAMNMAGCRPWAVVTPRHRCFGNKSITTRSIGMLSHVTGQDVRTRIVRPGIDTSRRNLAEPPPRPIDSNKTLCHLEPLISFR
jgi:hypothetical protein